jgi:hypothetical protein
MENEVNEMEENSMQTPWTRARKLRYQTQEDRIGNLPGGSKQANSGRIWRWKRDGILHEFLIEARTTDKGSYRIEGKEFLSIRREGHKTPPGLHPGMQIDIQGLSLMVIQLDDFNQLYEELLKLREIAGAS